MACLAWFFVDVNRGVDFGLSILWLLLFTPCSYVCWFRPLYGAFRYGSDAAWRSWPTSLLLMSFLLLLLCRSDSSFRFFLFFFVYICQFGIYVIQCIGITSWGTR